MGYICKEEMSQETRNYLLGLHLKWLNGREIDYEGIHAVVIDEETHNIFFRIAGHLEYPIMIWEYILVYKEERIVIEIESGGENEDRIVRIWLSQAIQNETKVILNTVVKMVCQYYENLIFNSKMKYLVTTDNIKYLIR